MTIDTEINEPFENEKEIKNPRSRSNDERVQEEIQKSINYRRQNQNPEEEEDKRLVQPANFQPSNPIDIAHLLLTPSILNSYSPELDKEIKLGNLSKEDKAAIWEFQGVSDSILWLRNQSNKRKLEFEKVFGTTYDNINPEDAMLQEIEVQTRDEMPEIFDSLNALKKSQRIAVLSRGTRGFERIQQVSTISTHINENVDSSEAKPGFLSRMSGGFKK